MAQWETAAKSLNVQLHALTTGLFKGVNGSFVPEVQLPIQCSHAAAV